MASDHVLKKIVWPSSSSDSDDAADGDVVDGEGDVAAPGGGAIRTAPGDGEGDVAAPGGRAAIDSEDDAVVGDGEIDAAAPDRQADAAAPDSQDDAAAGHCETDAAAPDRQVDAAAPDSQDDAADGAAPDSQDDAAVGDGETDAAAPDRQVDAAALVPARRAIVDAVDGEYWGMPGSCMPEAAVGPSPKKTRFYDHVFRTLLEQSPSSSSSTPYLNLVRHDYKALQMCAVSTLCQPPDSYDMSWKLQADGEDLYEHCKEAILRVLRAGARRFYVGITNNVFLRWQLHKASKRGFVSMDVLLQSSPERNRAVEIRLCYAFHDGHIVLEGDGSCPPLSELILNVRESPPGALKTNPDGDNFLYVCWC